MKSDFLVKLTLTFSTLLVLNGPALANTASDRSMADQSTQETAYEEDYYNAEYYETGYEAEVADAATYATLTPSSSTANPQQFEAPNPSSGQYSAALSSQAIAVSFPSNLAIEVKKGKEYPVTLMLVRPAVDSYGVTIAPANSLVNARVIREDGSAKIVTDAIITDNQVIPYSAASMAIPLTNIGQKQSQPMNIGGLPINSIMSLVGGVTDFGDDAQGYINAAGTGINMLGSMASGSSIKGINVSQGSIYILNQE